MVAILLVVLLSWLKHRNYYQTTWIYTSYWARLFRHDEDLQAVIDVSKWRFFLERDVQHMAGLMARMDVAITGGGEDLFELAAVGVLIVGATEESREVETMDIRTPCM